MSRSISLARVRVESGEGEIAHQYDEILLEVTSLNGTVSLSHDAEYLVMVIGAVVTRGHVRPLSDWRVNGQPFSQNPGLVVSILNGTETYYKRPVTKEVSRELIFFASEVVRDGDVWWSVSSPAKDKTEILTSAEMMRAASEKIYRK
jgi:hypothetical protein